MHVEIGERLKKFRKSIGVSQSEFAERLKIHQPNLSEIEKGTRTLGGGILQKLMNEYTQLSIKWLMLGEGEMILKEPRKVQNIDELLLSSLRNLQAKTEILWEHYINNFSKQIGVNPDELRRELEDSLIRKQIEGIN